MSDSVLKEFSSLFTKEHNVISNTLNLGGKFMSVMVSGETQSFMASAVPAITPQFAHDV